MTSFTLIDARGHWAGSYANLPSANARMRRLGPGAYVLRSDGVLMATCGDLRAVVLADIEAARESERESGVRLVGGDVEIEGDVTEGAKETGT